MKFSLVNKMEPQPATSAGALARVGTPAGTRRGFPRVSSGRIPYWLRMVTRLGPGWVPRVSLMGPA